MRNDLLNGFHVFYHHHAGLSNAQVDRYTDSAALLKAFPSTSTPTGTVTTLQKHRPLIASLVKKIDERFHRAMATSDFDKQQTTNYLTSFGNMNSQMNPSGFSLALTAEEKTYWTSGVPAVMQCGEEELSNCSVTTNSKYQIGEMFGYAYKLFASDTVRSIGIDFQFPDVHGSRTKHILETQAAQAGKPLARLIASLKAAGIWNRTIIAMYTLDGGRSPLLDSYGHNGKNTLVLAGGRIKGGYYGDVSVVNGTPRYHRPDDNGVAVATGVTERGGRVAAADIYKTVVHAMGAPQTVYDGFTDVKAGKLLQYMLKA